MTFDFSFRLIILVGVRRCTHKPLNESFRPLLRTRTHQYAKVLVKLFQKRRLSLAKGNQTARSLWRRSQAAKYSRTVCTERCKYPVSALAERGCKSARDIGGRHRIYYKLDITKCAVLSSLQSFFFVSIFAKRIFCKNYCRQRKSVKRFSGSKSVAFGNVMHSLREHDVTAKPS